MNLCRAQQSLFIETHRELCKEGMTMPQEDHVLITIESHAHRFASVMSGQCRERRWRGGLRFLAAKTPAHARALYHDLVRRQFQHLRDDLLDLGRMLCG